MKNLCIFPVVFVSLISLNSVQSAALEQQEKALETEEKSQPELRDYISDCFALINKYRAKHGSPALSFDGGLSGAATSCAKKYAGGASIHSCSEAKGLGENVASGSGPITVQQLCPTGVNAWYAENKQYNYNSPNVNAWESTGHFTYMIWKSSTAAGLGCASGSTVRCVFLVRPKGNTPTVAAYKANVGPPKKEAEEKEDQLLMSQIQKYNVTIN